ncbi:MAG: hypothetical protein M1820_004285 [Bogoriella megaspora]|nr:MAG: hypothetical protein M1820_004285 [Bogoriella megaspora]
MAPEKKNPKRKHESESAAPAKKVKKSTKSRTISQVAAGQNEEPTGTVQKSTSVIKSSRKRAADFFEGDADVSVKPSPSKTKPVADKPARRVKTKSIEITEEKPVAKAHKASTKTKVISEEVEQAGSGEDDESEGVDADRTAALLAGFESSDDETDQEGNAAPEAEGLSLDQIPAIPDAGKAQKQKKGEESEKEGPGVIYIGRIPHGFYEAQMRAYFKQFGKIRRLRLSRNKKTGRSKHYAFIEFASAEVADIVARTMNKYLMFGHILQVSVIPPNQVHEKLFVGANRRFKPVPRNKIEGKSLSEPQGVDRWQNRVEKESVRRSARKKKLAEMGYEFDAPLQREVPVPDAVVAKAQPVDGEAESKDLGEPAEVVEEVKAIEAKPEVAEFTEPVMSKTKTKNGAKSKKSKKTAVAA